VSVFAAAAIVDTQTFAFTEKSSTFDLEIKPEYSPNARIRVDVVGSTTRSIDETKKIEVKELDVPRPAVATGTTEIDVLAVRFSKSWLSRLGLTNLLLPGTRWIESDSSSRRGQVRAWRFNNHQRASRWLERRRRWLRRSRDCGHRRERFGSDRLQCRVPIENFPPQESLLPTPKLLPSHKSPL